jgi:2-polyprenyl-6-methoxyphenol hydroxylase-like FAD-dependent oxidoreductase
MPATTTRTDVIVVGAGIGGLAAALLLGRSGRSVLVLERVAEPADVGAGLLLQPNGLAVLDALGLATSLGATGHPIAAADIRRPDGRLVMHAPIGGHGPGLDHALAVRRSALHRLLLSAVAGAPSVTMRLGAAVLSVDAGGTVRLAGDEQTLHADLVVGADGVGSVVRASGDFGTVVTGSGATYVRGTVEGEDAALRGEYWTPLGLFGGAPLGDGTSYFYASAQHESVAAALSRGDLPALRSVWADALPLTVPLLRAVATYDDLLVNDVTRVDAERWSDGALVLLGDAAHAMAPTLGQGANSALVDAAVLALELGATDDRSGALLTYERRRRPAVRKVQDAADRVTKLSNVNGSVATRVVDLTLRAVARSARAAARQDRLVQQEDPARLRESLTRLGGRWGPPLTAA